jgi:hypothetical protein
MKTGGIPNLEDPVLGGGWRKIIEHNHPMIVQERIKQGTNGINLRASPKLFLHLQVAWKAVQ